MRTSKAPPAPGMRVSEAVWSANVWSSSWAVHAARAV